MKKAFITVLTAAAVIVLMAVLGAVALKVFWAVLQTMFTIPDLSWAKAFILCLAGRFIVGSASEVKFNKD